MKSLKAYLELSAQIPGWTRGAEAEALIQRCYDLPRGAIVVEVGTFFGSGAVLLGGARKLKRSGRVHCIDPFDGSGDAVSVPHYHAIRLAFWGKTQFEHFSAHIQRAGLERWVTAHTGTAEAVAATWNTPIDLLFLDGDQSPRGARLAFDAWAPWLKPGGLLALHNSDPRLYEPEHDGHYQLTQTVAVEPAYHRIELVGSTTYLTKAVDDPSTLVRGPRNG
jgi:predicted O-methyltransferase YrrM